MKSFLLIGLKLLVLVAFIVPASAAPNIVRVPDVIGMKEGEAIKVLKKAGLRSGVISIKSKGRDGAVAKLYIGRKEIVAKRPVKKGTKIIIGVVANEYGDTTAKKEKLIKIPDLAGLTVQEARSNLAGKGLHLGRILEKTDSHAKNGTIISQNPKEGKAVSSKVRIDIIVAGIEEVRIPDLKGKSEEEASQNLARVGLRIGRVNQRKHPVSEPETVVEQNPRAGTIVEKESKVNLVISMADEAELPGVVGLEQKEAVGILEEAGFKVAVLYVDEQGKSPGKVLKVLHGKGRIVKGMLLTLLLPHPMDPSISSEGTPDLRIVEERLTVVVPDPADPKQVEVTIPIQNIGTMWASAFTVRWYLHGQSNELGCSQDVMNGLGVGEEIVVMCRPFPYSVHGTMHWRANVDEEGEIAGDPPENNVARGEVVISAFPLTPDLEIRDVMNIQTPDPARPNEPYSVVFDILVQNIGDMPAGPFTLRWYPHRGDKTEVGCEIRDNSGLERDETATYRCTEYTYSTYGNMHWLAVVDENGEVANDPPGNNEFGGEVLIEREEKPDLVITEAHYEQQHEPVSILESGKRFKAVFTVKNQGSVEADPFSVVWRFENETGLGNCCSTEIVKHLSPGVHVTKSFTNLTAPAVSVNDEDHFAAIVDVDPENVVDEGTNEENNEFDKGLLVRGPLLERPEEVGSLQVCRKEAKPENKARIKLCWQDRSVNEDGFHIDVRTSAQTLFKSQEEGTDADSSWIVGLSCGANYTFEVHAFNEAGRSGTVRIGADTIDCDKPDLTVTSLSIRKPGENGPGTYDVIYEITNTRPDVLITELFTIRAIFPYCSKGNRMMKSSDDVETFDEDGKLIHWRGTIDTTGIEARCLSGNEEISVEVDLGNDVDEAVESNNIETRTIHFQ